MNVENDKLFEKLVSYFENINKSDYWPDNKEYPEEERLWSITKSKNFNNK